MIDGTWFQKLDWKKCNNSWYRIYIECTLVFLGFCTSARFLPINGILKPIPQNKKQSKSNKKNRNRDDCTASFWDEQTSEAVSPSVNHWTDEHQLHSLKLRAYPWEMDGWKTIFLFGQTVSFEGNKSFQLRCELPCEIWQGLGIFWFHCLKPSHCMGTKICMQGDMMKLSKGLVPSDRSLEHFVNDGIWRLNNRIWL